MSSQFPPLGASGTGEEQDPLTLLYGYLPLDGSEAMQGILDLGDNDIRNVNDIYLNAGGRLQTLPPANTAITAYLYLAGSSVVLYDDTNTQVGFLSTNQVTDAVDLIGQNGYDLRLYSGLGAASSIFLNYGGTDKLEVNSTGVRVGPVSTVNLYVSGNAYVEDALVSKSDTDTYIDLNAAADRMAFYAGGVEMLRLTEDTNDQVFVGPAGSATVPVLSNLNDTDTGLSWTSADVLDVVVGGVQMLSADQDNAKITLTRAAVLATGAYPNYEQYLYIPGSNATRIDMPDDATTSITGDIDLAVLVDLADYTPATPQALAAKFVQTGNQRSYELQVETNGTLRAYTSANGTTEVTFATSTVGVDTVATPGTKIWIRWTGDVDNGSAQRVAKFYTAPTVSATDFTPGTWTQLGTTVTSAGATSFFDSTALLTLGGFNAGTGNPPTGKGYGLLLNNAYDTADLWADADIKLMVGFTAPTGLTGWPIQQITGGDDSPSQKTWTIRGTTQPYMTLVPGADQVNMFSTDISAGNASLGLITETAVTSTSDVAVTHYLNVQINGAVYKLLLRT